jgi:hypothetical protein
VLTGFCQVEQFFVVNVDAGWQPKGVEEAHRNESILAFGWWSAEQMRSATQRAFPDDLAQRIEALCAHGCS